MIGWKEGWEANLEKAIRAIKALDKASYIQLTIDASGGVQVYAYPNNDPDEKRELVSGLTHLVGKMDKKVSGSEISLYGEKDGLTVHIAQYEICEIIGYVEEEVPETVTTGRTVVLKIPVSDCELKQGKHAGKQVHINAKEPANV